MYKILIVEDDEVISQTVLEHLKKWGYEAECVSDFQNVMGIFAKFTPHLVIMDIGLPYYNGYHWCSKIREVSCAPIIFLSSMSDNMNIVMAMNMGADDFIVKPFDMNVLTAKIQAMLRRTYSFGENNNIIEHKGAILNTSDQSFVYEENRAELSKNEYRILQCLLESRGKVVTRDRLMEKLWETDTFVDDNTLTVNVTRLRKKLEEIGLKNYIQTKKGMGYIIE